MRLTIENKSKQEIFVALIQLLKNWSSHIIIHFNSETIYIQSMDKSHICLADVCFNKNWFNNYECLKDTKLAVDSSQFSILMNFSLKHDITEISFDESGTTDIDKLYINFLNNKEKKSSFNHYFELQLIDVEEDSLEIPKVDYDVEFTIEAKKFVEVISELNTFGSNLNINCNENVVELNASGETTKLKVNIPIEDLDEYSINEGEELDISFSLNHISKMCSSIKLSPIINVSISAEFPMVIQYDLGNDSQISFYVAPKIID